MLGHAPKCSQVSQLETALRVGPLWGSSDTEHKHSQAVLVIRRAQRFTVLRIENANEIWY
jgi:hypothetical protein